jgi:hypothetical protein
MHPFVEAMVGLLSGSGTRVRRPALLNNLPTSENAKYWNDITFLRNLAQELVDSRKNNPEDKKDLLNSLVLGRDPQTGQGLTDDSIVDNMITFLIAGMDPPHFQFIDRADGDYHRTRNNIWHVVVPLLLPTKEPPCIPKSTGGS